MAYPSDLARTKDWGTEILTDADLEAQFDVIISWVDAFADETSGHKHDATSNEGPKIDLTTSVTGVLPEANGGTALSSGFLNGVPIGTILMWGTDTAPTGYVLCDGSAYSRTVTYDDLFGVIGTKFGSGDGSTTFNVPDLRGRIPLGQDDMGGSSANRVTDANADTLGGTLGSETHTLTESEIPAHTHDITSCDGTSGTGYKIANYANAANTQTVSNAALSTGGDGAHNNLQPSLTLNYIIRYA